MRTPWRTSSSSPAATVAISWRDGTSRSNTAAVSARRMSRTRSSNSPSSSRSSRRDRAESVIDWMSRSLASTDSRSTVVISIPPTWADPNGPASAPVEAADRDLVQEQPDGRGDGNRDQGPDDTQQDPTDQHRDPAHDRGHHNA